MKYKSGAVLRTCSCTKVYMCVCIPVTKLNTGQKGKTRTLSARPLRSYKRGVSRTLGNRVQFSERGKLSEMASRLKMYRTATISPCGLHHLQGSTVKIDM